MLEEPESVSSRGAVAITVRCDGSPLVGAEVLALFPNDTSVAAVTDSAGEATLDLHNMSRLNPILDTLGRTYLCP